MQQALEPLDIKYVTDGRATGFTHLVSKKRNNSKVMHALINCQLIVSQAFTDAVTRAAVPKTTDDGMETSPLEQDFEANWPDEASFVPTGPEGADNAFVPDQRRREIFDGYTFIFYDKRYENLLPVITAGKGKALWHKVVPRRTDVNDFIRYVKTVAGEKGLGEFEDGSEGRGVVVVRYTPPGDGDEETWYKDFFNEFALRLDHRPIEIRELLFAVLDVEPAQLRRPLLLEPTPRESGAPFPPTLWHPTSPPAKFLLVTQHQEPSAPTADPAMTMEIDDDGDDDDDAPPSPVIEESPSPPPPPTRQTRPRRAAAKSRFKSFDVSPDSDDDDEAQPATTTNTQPQPAAAESQGMFMTQQSDVAPHTQSAAATQPRKRPADIDIMDLVAPTAARAKRQRIERGETAPVPTPTAAARTPTPAPTPAPAPAPAKKGRKGNKGGGGGASGDELDAMIERGQEEEAARRAADELLRRQLQGGEIDFGGIRAETAVTTMPIRRRRPPPPGDGEADTDEQQQQQRWNPHWNGLTNFKKFRPQGEATGARVRVPPRKIISVLAVRAKEYGIGDEYWLQDGGTQKSKKNKQRSSGGNTQTQAQTQRASKTPVVISDNDNDDDNDDDDASLPEIADAPAPVPAPAPQARSRKGKAAERATQTQTQTQIQTTRQTMRATRKRSAPSPEEEEADEDTVKEARRPAKKKRAMRGVGRHKVTAAVAMGAAEGEEEDSDEEEETGIGFRFGKRK